MTYFDEIKENHIRLKVLLEGNILKIKYDHKIHFCTFLSICPDSNLDLYVFTFQLLDEKYKKYPTPVIWSIPILGINYQTFEISDRIVFKESGSYYHPYSKYYPTKIDVVIEIVSIEEMISYENSLRIINNREEKTDMSHLNTQGLGKTEIADDLPF